MSEDDYVSADAENAKTNNYGAFNAFKINDSTVLRKNKVKSKLPKLPKIPAFLNRGARNSNS